VTDRSVVCLGARLCEVMCKQCLVEALPARQRTTLDSGSYFLNFKHCAQCLERGQKLLETKRTLTTEDENEEYSETITYAHECQCGHVIASHEYTFTVVGFVQEHSMLCTLCGKGECTQRMTVDRRADVQQRSGAVDEEGPVVNLVQAFSHIPMVPNNIHPEGQHDLDEWQ